MALYRIIGYLIEASKSYSNLFLRLLLLFGFTLLKLIKAKRKYENFYH